MKSIRQQLVNKKRSNTLAQMKKKNDVSTYLRDKSKQEKIERLNKMNSTSQGKDAIKDKMETHFEKLEQDRLEIEKLVELRSKKFF
jgi:hypothetical protein